MTVRMNAAVGVVTFADTTDAVVPLILTTLFEFTLLKLLPAIVMVVPGAPLVGLKVEM